MKLSYSIGMIMLGLLLAGCSVQSTENDDPFASVPETPIVNGVQQATLSWGTLNYAPEIIKVEVGIPVRITGDMKRLTGCYRSFNIFPLGISKRFDEKSAAIEFTPIKVGSFPFGCSMGMGSGTLVVTG